MLNKIHFEVQDKKGARIDYPQSVDEPSVVPSFVLVYDYGWNDYGQKTLFYLYFFDENKMIHSIGEVKIMSSSHDDIRNILPEYFDSPLDGSYCSLGQSLEYYQSLYDLFSSEPVIINELMRFLRDCAYEPEIREQFSDDDVFKISLIRDLEAENALRVGRFLLTGVKPDKAYSFTYKFSLPKIEKFNFNWNVRFKYQIPGFDRTKCLIGENGTGKTLLLTNLAKDLVLGNSDSFSPNIPLFGSCLAICSTPLDGFDFNKKSYKIPYKSCSLLLEEDSSTNLIDNLNAIVRRPTVKKVSMCEKYLELLSKFLPQDICESLMTKNKDGDCYEVIDDVVYDLTRILSSGQLHELLLVSNICANIHFSSLLLIDEPEVHLHPKYIMKFMEMLSDILEMFESYAIIATHSPLIVREVIKDNVFLISEMTMTDGDGRSYKFSEIGKANFATFGEDVSKLYFDVFHYDERESLFYEIVRKRAYMIHHNDKTLSSSDVCNSVIHYFEEYQPLSLNGLLIINEVIDNIFKNS